MKYLKLHPLVLTLCALILGVVVGLLWGPGAASLGEVSKWIIACLKTVAIPLLFFAITDALLKAFVTSRGVVALFVAATINGVCAIAIALTINNLFHPGRSLTALASATTSTKTMSVATWQEMLAAFVPVNVFDPFITGSTPGVIVIALAIGFALRHLTHDVTLQPSLTSLHGFIELAFRTLLVIIHGLIYVLPIAVFCSVAKAVGQNGVGVIGELGVYAGFCLLGLGLHTLLVYHPAIILHPRITIAQFWRRAKAPVLYAFGINSSLATMPMTLEALDDLGVQPEAARLSACIGTNFNNDGILLYELLVALMLADAYGLQLSILDQLSVAGLAVMAALGVAGFPEAGVVALTLVLTTLKLPTEAIAILLSVDWIIARCRSATNVMGDFAVALQIDRWTPRA